MSFVSKILEHKGQVERRAVHEDMETLIQKQRELQSDVHQLAENKFSQFHPSLAYSDKLQQRVEDVTKSITNLENKINCEIKDQLSQSTAEFQSLTVQLSEAKAVGEALNYLSQIYHLYESSVTALKAKKYSEAITTLNQLDALFKQPLCNQDDKINILVTMKNEAFTQRLKVEQDMAEMWADCIKWNFPKDQKDDFENTKDTLVSSVSLSVGNNDEFDDVLKELVQGLHMTNLLNLRMKTFAEKFQKFVVPLILEPHIVGVDMKVTEGFHTLHIGIVPDDAIESKKGKQSKQNSKSKSNEIAENELYIAVFDRLINVLQHLHKMFLSSEFRRHDESGSSVEGTLMEILGRETSESLLETVQKEILAKAIPTSAKDLAGFESVKSATHNLQEKLMSVGYITPEYQSLKTSVENVNLLFSNKKCELILVEARDLMTSDLLNPISVLSDNKPQGDLPMLTQSKNAGKSKKPQSLSDKLLSNDTFKMPDCQISENIMKLMHLTYTTLQEATESSPECAIQMYFAVHNIFKLFTDVVSTHHRNNIEKLPQMSALHYNNCMYIAHHLMTLGHQFALALPSSEQVTFVPLLQHIRESGWDFFLAQLERQKDILLECLDEADGFSCIEEDANRAKSERAMRQVLHQLHHLHKVWQPVLPINLYQKAIGKLMKSVVERITDFVTSMEDITQEACLLLTVILGPLEEECAQMMGIEAALLPVHIPNWTRLTNVKKVLNSSLLDIDTLWSDGKGPLALTFSPLELKQMIRALFQNTDRRADVLSRIK